MVRGCRMPIEEYNPQAKHYLEWDKGNVIQEPGMELVIPRGMLYEDIALNTKVIKDTAAIAYEYRLHDEAVPLQAGCTLMIGVSIRFLRESLPRTGLSGKAETYSLRLVMPRQV